MHGDAALHAGHGLRASEGSGESGEGLTDMASCLGLGPRIYKSLAFTTDRI